jgi:DNA polymerase
VTDLERRQALDDIAAEVRACTKCRLHETRTKAVPGEGDPETEVVFVGEGPGRDEDAQGRPFVGESGRLLTRLIGSLGWAREEVYITNVVKCRPPGNRDPQPDEMAACSGYLQRQLDVLDPALIVTLGRYSLGTFRPGERIGAVHGTTRPANGRDNALAFAMYHPAYAVRDKNHEPTLFADMTGVPSALLDARRRREAGDRGTAGPAVDKAAAAAADQSVANARSLEAPPIEPSQDPPPNDDPVPQLTLF